MARIQTLDENKTPIATNEVVGGQDPMIPAGITMEQLVNMVWDMKNEIKQLKEQDTPSANSDKKAHYVWPAFMNYKLWDGVPVLDYKSVKKDSTKALAYRAVTGELVDNHLVELTLKDVELKKPILLYDFNMWYERSEKMKVGAILDDGTEIKELQIPKHVPLFKDIVSYVFQDKEFGELKVSPKIIN